MVKVNDSRMFNADGSLKDDSQVEAERQSRMENSENSQSETQTQSQNHEIQDDQSAGSKAPNPSEIDFSTFILSLASSVQISMGIVPNPMTGQTQKDLVHAKQTIDILGMLEQKTEGNLTPEESGMLKQVLFQLRMQYVDLNKASDS